MQRIKKTWRCESRTYWTCAEILLDILAIQNHTCEKNIYVKPVSWKNAQHMCLGSFGSATFADVDVVQYPEVTQMQWLTATLPRLCYKKKKSLVYVLKASCWFRALISCGENGGEESESISMQKARSSTLRQMRSILCCFSQYDDKRRHPIAFEECRTSFTQP